MKAKKVGLLNLQYSDFNYGALLQAAAIENVISKLGYDVKHINFKPQLPPTSPNNFRDCIGWLARNALPIELLDFLKSFLAGSYPFFSFRKKALTLTKKVSSHNDMISLCEKMDYVVVGSDQVWRTQYTSPFEMSFFLKGLPKSTARISYAASFGVDTWISHNRTEEVTAELSKFKAVSVREDSGVTLCKNKFKVIAEHVLDPTLLVGREFFEKLLAGKSAPDSGIAHYKLDMTDHFKSQLNALSRYFKCEITNIYFEQAARKKKYRNVDEWLLSIKHANVVVSDSYHCICLAILFEKEFICVANSNRGLTRLTSLLSLLEINDRLFHEGVDLPNKLTKIDYENVKEKMASLRSKSMNFIKNSLCS